MNGNTTRIEIIKPFGQAFDLMKKVLFQPFDLAKWCVIGFAAFLANFSSGMNLNVNFPFNSHGWHWNYAEMRTDVIDTFHGIPAWVMPFAVIGGLVGIAIVVLLIWLGARGRFMLTDCLVRNRAAIVEPWKEFRREGNSYFLFSVAVLVIGLAISAPLIVPLILAGDRMHFNALVITGIVVVATLLLVVSLAFHLVTQLMVPVMYRRRCLSLTAFKEVVSLITDNPVSLILYLLFLIVLAIGCLIIARFATCLTCCFTAIPYVGTVILLPIYVTLYGFTLFLLKQFGPDYDVWAGVTPTASPVLPPVPPAEPPPLQT